MVFQPGFNSLVGVIEHDAESGIDTSIIDNGFNKAKLFCNLDKPDNGPEPEVPTPPAPIDASNAKFGCLDIRQAKFKTRRSIIIRILTTYEKEREARAGTKELAAPGGQDDAQVHPERAYARGNQKVS